MRVCRRELAEPPQFPHWLLVLVCAALLSALTHTDGNQKVVWSTSIIVRSPAGTTAANIYIRWPPYINISCSGTSGAPYCNWYRW